jgi:hypothetical protein
MAAIQNAIDEIPGAFEKSVPKRLRQPHDSIRLRGSIADTSRNAGSRHSLRLELGFEYRSRGIRFDFIDGGPYQAQIRSIAIPEHMALKCDLRIWIDLAIVFNPHIASPLLSLIAKRATELKPLIFLEKTDRELNVHGQILIQLLLPTER